MKNNHLSKSILFKGIVKGIVVSILSATMTLSTLLPATNYMAYAEDFGSMYEPGEKEALGLKNVNSTNSFKRAKNNYQFYDLRAIGDVNNSARLDSFIVGMDSTQLEAAKKNSTKNYSKYVNDDSQLYQTWQWGRPGDDDTTRIKAEKDGICTLDTYVRVSTKDPKTDKPKKKYRALYIMSLCKAHGFTWQAAAATITELIKQYEHVDVIAVRCPGSSEEYKEHSNEKRGAAYAMGGSYGEGTDYDRTHNIFRYFGVALDVQNMKPDKKIYNTSKTFKELVENGEYETLKPVNKDKKDGISAINEGAEYKCVKGLISKDGKDMSIKPQNVKGGKISVPENKRADSGSKSLFQAKEGDGTNSWEFGGDKHAQGYEMIALQAYFDGTYGTRSLEDPATGNNNGVSMVYINMDGSGWMGRTDEKTGFFPGKGSIMEYNYSQVNGGKFMNKAWDYLIKLRESKRYMSLGSSSAYPILIDGRAETNGVKNASPSAMMNTSLLWGKRARIDLPSGWHSYNEYLNLIAGACHPEDWKKTFGTGWKNGDISPFLTAINNAVSFSGWKKHKNKHSGHQLMKATGDSKSTRVEMDDITVWFGKCQTIYDVKGDQSDYPEGDYVFEDSIPADNRASQTMLRGTYYTQNDGENVIKAWEKLGTKEGKDEAFVTAKITPMNQGLDPEHIFPSGQNYKIVRTYYESRNPDYQTRVYKNAQKGYYNKDVLKYGVSDDLGKTASQAKGKACEECGCTQKPEKKKLYYCPNHPEDGVFTSSGKCTHEVGDSEHPKQCGKKRKKVVRYFCPGEGCKYHEPSIDGSNVESAGSKDNKFYKKLKKEKHYIIGNYAYNVTPESKVTFLQTDKNGMFKKFKNLNKKYDDNTTWRSQRILYSVIWENAINSTYVVGRLTTPQESSKFKAETAMTRDGTNNLGEAAVKHGNGAILANGKPISWVEYDNLYYPDMQNFDPIPDGNGGTLTFYFKNNNLLKKAGVNNDAVYWVANASGKTYSNTAELFRNNVEVSKYNCGDPGVYNLDTLNESHWSKVEINKLNSVLNETFGPNDDEYHNSQDTSVTYNLNLDSCQWYRIRLVGKISGSGWLHPCATELCVGRGNGNGDTKSFLIGQNVDTIRSVNSCQSGGTPVLNSHFDNDVMNFYHYGKVNADESLQKINSGDSTNPYTYQDRDPVNNYNKSARNYDFNKNIYDNVKSWYLENGYGKHYFTDNGENVSTEGNNNIKGNLTGSNYPLKYQFAYVYQGKNTAGEYVDPSPALDSQSTFPIYKNKYNYVQGTNKQTTFGTKYNVAYPDSNKTTENASTFRGWNYNDFYKDVTTYKRKTSTTYIAHPYTKATGGNDPEGRVLSTGEFSEYLDAYHHWLPFNKKNNCFVITFDTNKYMFNQKTTDKNQTSKEFQAHLYPSDSNKGIKYWNYSTNKGMSSGDYSVLLTSKSKKADCYSLKDYTSISSALTSLNNENANHGFIQRYYSVYGTDQTRDNSLQGKAGVYYGGKYFRGITTTTSDPRPPVSYWNIYFDRSASHYFSERDLEHNKWDRFPDVKATGCTFLGWNTRPDGRGTWISQKKGETIKFDGQTFTTQEIIPANITSNASTWPSWYKDVKKAGAKNGLFDVTVDGVNAMDEPGQEVTLYAIYTDNSDTKDSASAYLPKLDPATGITFDETTGEAKVNYGTQSWEMDWSYKTNFNGKSAVSPGFSYYTAREKSKGGSADNEIAWKNLSEGKSKLMNGKNIGTYVFTGTKAGGQLKTYVDPRDGIENDILGDGTKIKNVAKFATNDKGQKVPLNGNPLGWTNASNPGDAYKGSTAIPKQPTTARIKGQDKATGVNALITEVMCWTREGLGTVQSYMAGRTSVTSSSIDLNRQDYIWDSVPTAGTKLLKRVAVKGNINNPTDAKILELKKPLSNFSDNETNYDIGFKIQGTTYVESSVQSRQYDDAWKDVSDTGTLTDHTNYKKYPIENADKSKSGEKQLITKHGMPAYDDSYRQVYKDGKMNTTTPAYSETKPDDKDHVVVKIDFTPPKIEEKESHIIRKKTENDGWGFDQPEETPKDWNKLINENKSTDDFIDESMWSDNAMYTTFDVKATDYNEEEYGAFLYNSDSAGIQGVYVLVRDPDTGTYNGTTKQYTGANQKIYKLALDPTRPYIFTTNPDMNILEAFYVLSINLYTEFPAANRLVYQMFAVDNAGNTSVGPAGNLGKWLNPEEYDLDDPSPPDSPDPEKPPMRGIMENFSLKANLVSDEGNEFNRNPDKGDVYFQAGDLGHFSIATVGYAGLYAPNGTNSVIVPSYTGAGEGNKEYSWTIGSGSVNYDGRKKNYAKTQNDDWTAIEIDTFKETPNWAINQYNINNGKGWKNEGKVSKRTGNPVGGEIGLEAYREIRRGVIPIKYNTGIATNEKIPNDYTYVKNGSNSHAVERRLPFRTKNNKGAGKVVKPPYFTYYYYDAATDSGKLQKVYPGTKAYNERLYAKNGGGDKNAVPYAMIWTWYLGESPNADTGAFRRSDSGGDGSGIDTDGWEDKGSRFRVPPYYEMQSEITGYNSDGSPVHAVECHPWEVHAYKNTKERTEKLVYYIFDSWTSGGGGNLHHRIIHEEHGDLSHNKN